MCPILRSLQSSLSVLNCSRAAEMEHQRGQPSAEQGLQQPRRDPTSFSGPMATPSTTSTPLERKQRVWYVTDSFAEQFSPPGPRCAQSCFESQIGCQLPVVHVPPLQQQREALGRSPVSRLPGKRLPLSDLSPLPPQKQRDALQTATPVTNPDGPTDGDGENTDPLSAVKACLIIVGARPTAS